MDGWYELMSVEELRQLLDSTQLSDEEKETVKSVLLKKLNNLEQASDHED